jgi:hypothetical protein
VDGNALLSEYGREGVRAPNKLAKADLLAVTFFENPQYVKKSKKRASWRSQLSYTVERLHKMQGGCYETNY